MGAQEKAAAAAAAVRGVEAVTGSAEACLELADAEEEAVAMETKVVAWAEVGERAGPVVSVVTAV